MNVEPRPSENTDPELEQLVAYLDGELEAEAAREVERRLAADAAYRQRLNRLQQSRETDLWKRQPRTPKCTRPAWQAPPTPARAGTICAETVGCVERNLVQ